MTRIQNRFAWAIAVGLSLLVLAIASTGHTATATSPSDTVADRVFGQAGSFTTGTCNQGGSLSIGSLCFPSAAVDAAGNLYVADDLNSRVLEYDNPLTTDTVADRVFGQGGSFASDTCNLGGISASSLCIPDGLALDRAGNLYVADEDNNRVLEYDTPLTTDTVADRVIGQDASFTTSDCNEGLADPSAFSLCDPRGVALDGAGNVYVGDFVNSRVLEYDRPLTTDTVADRVFGQNGSFTSSTINLGGITAGSLNNPDGVALGPAGNLYVADVGNSRVLEFDNPLTTGTVADRVFGQPDFTSNACIGVYGGTPSSASSLCYPFGVALDRADNLYVADTYNNRVLEYDSSLTTDTVADRVFGQPDFASGDCNRGGNPSADSLCNPSGVALDGAGNLYVADVNNNRVLEYDRVLAGVSADKRGCPNVAASNGAAHANAHSAHGPQKQEDRGCEDARTELSSRSSAG